MQTSDLSRRRFHKLTVAAFGGLVAGAGSRGFAEDKTGDKQSVEVDPSYLLSEPHVCRGLNTCKGKGKTDNACAGQGACAAVKAHSCAGENDCKGHGGCGGYPGQNTCKGKGECAVPLSQDTWKLARKQFEQLMKGAGKKVGKAPAKS